MIERKTVIKYSKKQFSIAITYTSSLKKKILRHYQKSFFRMILLPKLMRYQPVLDSKVVTILVAVYLLSFTNLTFWKKGIGYFSGHEGQLFLLGIALFTLHIAVMLLFSAKYIIKPVFIISILVAAVSSHFVDSFGTLINVDMIRNAATTTRNEARHLFTMGYFFDIAFYGLLPSLLLLWTKTTFQPFKKKLIQDSILAAGSLTVTISFLLLNYASYASTFREKHDFMGSLHPAAPIASTIKYVNSIFRNRNIVVRSLGTDAQKGILSATLSKPRLTIIIAGETARAQNFSLGGYQRDTNPQLKTRNVLYFENVTSCGTATAVSLPCMFSNYTRQTYNHHKGLVTENVVDVLTHAGIKVEWWDNNTGDKGIGNRIKSINISHDDDATHCQGGECRDSIFLKYLTSYIKNLKQDTVLILHQIGSHGPTYYLRYPKEFEKFRPACRTAEFAKCSHEEIVRAYDNTILFTDHILAQTIDLLKAHEDKFSSSMLYMSDHGESLGEYGMYLHGFPYSLAPKTQIHVPFIAWFSKEFQKDNHLDISCIRAKTKAKTSHDTLFHSILGVMNITTSVYQKNMDIFASCRY